MSKKNNNQKTDKTDGMLYFKPINPKVLLIEKLLNKITDNLETIRIDESKKMVLKPKKEEMKNIKKRYKQYLKKIKRNKGKF
jgi:hypothetical protein